MKLNRYCYRKKERIARTHNVYFYSLAYTSVPLLATCTLGASALSMYLDSYVAVPYFRPCCGRTFFLPPSRCDATSEDSTGAESKIAYLPVSLNFFAKCINWLSS